MALVSAPPSSSFSTTPDSSPASTSTPHSTRRSPISMTPSARSSWFPLSGTTFRRHPKTVVHWSVRVDALSFRFRSTYCSMVRRWFCATNESAQGPAALGGKHTGGSDDPGVGRGDVVRQPTGEQNRHVLHRRRVIDQPRNHRSNSWYHGRQGQGHVDRARPGARARNGGGQRVRR